MPADKSPAEQALDLLLYVPLGVLAEVRAALPRLAESGRRHYEGQVNLAKFIGQFAVTKGQQEAGKVVPRVVQRLKEQGRPTPAPSPAAGAQVSGAQVSGAQVPGAQVPGAPAPVREHEEVEIAVRLLDEPTTAASDAAEPADAAAPALESIAAEPAAGAGGVAEADVVEVALVADAPVADVPVPDAPVADVPVPDAPVADVPVPDAPVADVPDAPVADAPVPEADSLAIPDYDSLAASQVVPRLAGLSADELDAVRRYETAKRGRRTILGRISQLQTER